MAYSGIILDQPGMNGTLGQALQEYIAPLISQAWITHNRVPGPGNELLPHHFTIAAKPLPEDMKSFINEPAQITCTHWGQNELAAAVLVECYNHEIGKIPKLDPGPKHITVAISPLGKPFHSNQITEWHPLPKEIHVTGIIREIMRIKFPPKPPLQPLPGPV